MGEEWSEVGVDFLHLSTTDIFEAPCQSKLKQGVKFIKEFEKKDESGSIYIHCKAGRTRSATLVACYLIEKYDLEPERAIELISEKRPHIWLGTKQLQAIKEYFEDLKKAKLENVS
ncbi:Phosphatidylglycerophosphatase and protein-tyrosine phosphatase 1 [Armadillidium nasatum]|uniref:Phosphatidylglycerophosphatase and protein-tyrosine phosphatase 1 n=1 Tax=Armadillidium nasatum TaxID=96803 RepID=A0A5N5SPZ9_9CRUS|nr:Phosphatidylglycerophosphatase and protein-tyrosine phosphatase 1 [Armadillidium nasatum]